MTPRFFLLLVLLGCAAGCDRPASRQPLPQQTPSVDTAAALRQTLPDLDRRLDQFKAVQMPLGDQLTDRERRMVDQLVAACGAVERMFWRQSDPEGLALYSALSAVQTSAGRDLRHYLLINGGRWDLVDQNRPFVGEMPMPPGHALYPRDLARESIEAYVSAHPERRADIYSPYTVIRRQGEELITRPYHEEFKPYVDHAASALRQAAEFADDPAFGAFLRLRADALTKDDYYASDLAWLDLHDPKFDIIFAPYETYLDGLLGVKTSYGAAVLIRNDVESQNLATYQRWVPDIQEALPLSAGDRPTLRGRATPMEVMDAPYRAGDLRHGYQAVADNLPNDPRVHQEKGTKKIFFKNFMDARVTDVILPLAGRILDAEGAGRASAAGYLAVTVMHEISHGLGPAFARHNNQQVDIREAIGSLYSGLEEAKADVVGMFGLKWLVDHGVLDKHRLEEYYASYVAGIFRTVRFGTGEAHGRAEMMEFNVLAEEGALVKHENRYQIVYEKMPAAIAQLARELLEQEATGNRSRAEAWFARYDRMPDALREALSVASDVPVDIDPMFSFPDFVE